MSRFSLSSIFISLGILLLFSSCAKEEFTVGDIQSVYTEQTSEAFLANQGLPAIMFSYNVFDANNNILSSWLIDSKGNIRSSEVESDVAYEGEFLSAYYLDKKKEESVATDITVDLDKLVENFKRIGVVGNLKYDQSVEAGESENITAIYGYYYVSAAQSESCGCSSDISDGESSSLQMYEPVLLEQRVGTRLIQLNSQAGGVLTWLKALNKETEGK